MFVTRFLSRQYNTPRWKEMVRRTTPLFTIRACSSHTSPSDRKYTKSHEWIKIESQGIGIVGITKHASEELGVLVFVELPEIGTKLEAGERMAAVESAKAATDIYIPVTGIVEEVNFSLEKEPNLVNDSPFEDGWLAKISIEDEIQISNLLTHEQYEKWLEEDK